MPATDRLLDPQRGQEILDIACGNGNYSRLLGRRGARVLACDFCRTFLDRARQRTTADDGEIEYRLVDATDESQIQSLGQSRFDSAVCSMAMMDMPTIDPLLKSLRRVLKPGGRFVFSLPHPCFNSGSRLTAELSSEAGRMRQTFGVAIEKYLTPREELSAGIINQPEPHPLFHRPLSKILGSCFSAGFVVDGLEEPAFAPEAGANKNPFSWQKRPEIPPAIVIRLRNFE